MKKISIYLIIVTLLIIAIPSVFSAGVLTAYNVTEHYGFNEGSGTNAQDESSNSNNFTLSSATWATSAYCLMGSCVNSSSATTLLSVKNSAIQNGDARTLIMAMYINSSTADDYLYYSGATSGATARRQFTIQHNSGAYVKPAISSNTWTEDNNITSYYVPYQNWIILYSVYYSSNNTVLNYINGTLRSGYTLGGALTTVPAPIRLFQTSTGSNHPTNTLADEITTIGGTLSQANITQIQNCYNTGYDPYTSYCVPSNASITATDTYVGNTIYNLTAIVNGTTYTTTTGTITLPYLSNSTALVSISLNATDNGGYFTKSFSSYNISASLSTTLAQSITTFNILEINTNQPLTNYNISTTYLTNQTHYMKKGLYNYTVNFSNSYFNYSVTTPLNITALSTNVITAYAWARNITFVNNITSASIVPTCYQYQNYNSINQSYSTNLSYQQMPKENNNIQCSLTYYQPFYITNTTYPDTSTYRMSPVSLIISFSNITYGVITQTISDIGQNLSMSFNNTLVLLPQSTFNYGRVNVMFNAQWLTSTVSNWTQYYEYDNDLLTQINESIAIVNSPNWVTYLQVNDNFGQPITDAIVRVAYTLGNNLSNWNQGKLLGQRFTDYSGNTFFISDRNSQAIIFVSKSGYTSQVALYNPGDVSTTSTNPKIITLRRSTTTNPFGVYATYFSPQNTSNKATFQINALTYNGVTCNTAKGTATSQPNLDISSYIDSNELGIFTYSITNPAYLNGSINAVNTITCNILNNNVQVTSISFNISNSLISQQSINIIPQNTANINVAFGFVIILIFSIIAQLVIDYPRSGVYAFLILSTIMSYISWVFVLPIGIIIIYLIGSQVRKMYE